MGAMKSKYIISAFAVTGLLISSYSSYIPSSEVGKQINSNSIIVANDSNNIWDDLRDDFELKHYSQHANVVAQRKRFLNEEFGLAEILERGAPYLQFISEELKKRDMPMELAFLPLVESEYNPNALSPKKAAGLWQLMPATAKILGVKQNNEYDGRHDIYTSTRAALNHLDYLHEKFNGDWLLALAAYNAGEVPILRAIEKNRAAGKSTHYWALDIPFAETRAYVPRLLALADIINNADKYDLELPKVENDEVLVHVALSKQTNLNQAAKLLDVSLDELYTYNPGIKRHSKTTPTNGPHHLMVPAEKAQKIVTLQNASDKKMA
jgi:membrane-bound lytic murein transglycosylase D